MKVDITKGGDGTIEIGEVIIYTDRTGMYELRQLIDEALSSTEADEPIHIPSDVAAPLEVEK